MEEIKEITATVHWGEVKCEFRDYWNTRAGEYDPMLCFVSNKTGHNSFVHLSTLRGWVIVDGKRANAECLLHELREQKGAREKTYQLYE